MPPLIELVDIARYYQMGDERIAALDGVSFAVERGEMVAIVGSSGSGKSTLLNILGCLDTPSSGRYQLAGKDVQELGDDARAHVRNHLIGFVFQSFQLLHRATALKNVALPLQYRSLPARERERRARAALARVGLDKRMTHRPFQLSGGQRQRTAIARALIGERRLVLADEPTGALDSQTSEAVLRVLRKRCDDGAAGILVTHEPRYAAYADRTIFLRDGRIVDSTGQPTSAVIATSTDASAGAR